MFFVNTSNNFRQYAVAVPIILIKRAALVTDMLMIKCIFQRLRSNSIIVSGI